MIYEIFTIVFTFYLLIKAGCELRLNGIYADNDQPVYGSHIHSNQHMVLLVFIIVYSIINILASIFFYYIMEGISETVHIYLSVKFSLLNVGWLIAINHFKQERTNETKSVTILDLFKF